MEDANLIFLLYSYPLRACSVMGFNQYIMCQLWLFESYFHISVSRLYVCVSFVVPFQLRRWFQLFLAPGFYEKIKWTVSVFRSPQKRSEQGNWQSSVFLSSFATIFSLFWENPCVDEQGSAIWWLADESKDKPLMAGDEPLPGSCSEKNLVWKKVWSWYRQSRLEKVNMHTFLEIKTLW